MKRIMMILSAVMLLGAVASCEKYEDGKPAKDIRTEFDRMYPDAWDVEWGYEGTIWEVSFETGTRPNGTERQAWYDMDGNWIQTMTEVYIVSVPQNIKDYLQKSEFSSGQFADDDAEYVEKPDGNFYRFDIRFDGKEIEVEVTEDGKVSRSVYGF